MPFPIGVFIAATAASVVGSVISNVLSNKSNKDIANQTNQLNSENLDKQLQAQRELQQEQNEYNSPQNQVSMLRQAGLSPSMAGLSSVTQSAASVPNSSPAVGYESRPVLPDTSSTLHQVMQAFSEYEDAKGASIDNQYRDKKNVQELDNARAYYDYLLSQSDLSDEQASEISRRKQIIDKELVYFDENHELDVENRVVSNKLIGAKIESEMRTQNREDARLALERTIAAHNLRLTDAQTTKVLNESETLSALLPFLAQEKQADIALKRLDAMGKFISNDANVRRSFYENFFNQSAMLHQELKDASVVNQLVELAFGIGFNDIGNALKSVFTLVK